MTALWEYVLLLEIAYKLLEEDRSIYKNNHKLTERYNTLRDLYFSEQYHSEGDFSERLSVLLDRLGEKISAYRQSEGLIGLNNAQVAEALYAHPISELRERLTDYLQLKDEVWLLIDNIDKGWPSSGITEHDVTMVHCLIEGVEKLRRYLDRDNISCTPVIFLRNDVFELVVDRQADRGKISSVSVDWTDRSLLKELLRLRFVHRGMDKSLTFEEAWTRIAVQNVLDSQSIEFILDRCLMRPRALLDYVIAIIGYAINRRHELLQEGDITSGLKDYSLSLVENISLEIRDVAPDLENALYMFIDRAPSMKAQELFTVLEKHGIPLKQRENVTDTLIWYGVLGIELVEGATRYIYDVNYNFRMLKTILQQNGKTTRYVINPAFRQALAVSDPNQGVQPRLI